MKPCTTKLGKFIRNRRLKLQLTQDDIEIRSGIDRNIVGLVELGKQKYLKDHQLEKLAEVLKCSSDELRKRMPVKYVAWPQTELGKLIHSRRNEIGMTLEEFARKTKKTVSAVRQLETRKSPSMGYKLLKLLGNALDLNPSILTRFIIKQRQKETASELGQLIRSRRKELTMSLAELGNKVGVTRQHVSLIELGRIRLNGNKNIMVKISKALGLDLKAMENLIPRRKLKKSKEVNSLGGFLSGKRIELDLTQSELGRRTKLPGSYICQIELGKIIPRNKNLLKISEALSCEIPNELIPPPNIHKSYPRKERTTRLGRFVTARRLELKLSQGELARQVDINPTLMTGIETGSYSPKNKVMGKLFKALGCAVPTELTQT